MDTTQVSNPLGDMATTMAQGMSGPSQNPISFDPSLLLNAVGASSPSKDGTAATSIQSNSGTNPPSDGDRLRSQAADIVSKARDVQTSALGQAPPQMQRPKYSPLETAIAAAVGGFLNSASPFTSEGTKALNAYMGVKEDAAKTDYENEVAKHTQALQAAQQGYRMAMDQAAPLQQQANFSDQNDAADARQESAYDHAKVEAQLARDFQAHQESQQHEWSIQGIQDARKFALHQQVLDHLLQIPQAKAWAMAQLAGESGMNFGEMQDVAKYAVHSSPEELKAILNNKLTDEYVKKIQMENKYLPQQIQLGLDTGALNNRLAQGRFDVDSQNSEWSHENQGADLELKRQALAEQNREFDQSLSIKDRLAKDAAKKQGTEAYQKYMQSQIDRINQEIIDVGKSWNSAQAGMDGPAKQATIAELSKRWAGLRNDLNNASAVYGDATDQGIFKPTADVAKAWVYDKKLGTRMPPIKGVSGQIGRLPPSTGALQPANPFSPLFKAQPAKGGRTITLADGTTIVEH